MKKNENILSCKSVKFYSRKDEDVFFEWIEKIDCIDKFEGFRNKLYLDLVERNLDDNDIQELIALFYRYKIDMKQLGRFLNDQNKEAFKPWHKKILGKTPKN